MPDCVKNSLAFSIFKTNNFFSRALTFVNSLIKNNKTTPLYALWFCAERQNTIMEE